MNLRTVVLITPYLRRQYDNPIINALAFAKGSVSRFVDYPVSAGMALWPVFHEKRLPGVRQPFPFNLELKMD